MATIKNPNAYGGNTQQIVNGCVDTGTINTDTTIQPAFKSAIITNLGAGSITCVVSGNNITTVTVTIPTAMNYEWPEIVGNNYNLTIVITTGGNDMSVQVIY